MFDASNSLKRAKKPHLCFLTLQKQLNTNEETKHPLYLKWFYWGMFSRK